MSDKIRTITLTGRPPVKVNDDAWGLIASASDKDYEGQVESQSFRTSKWFVGVRQHDDGRAIVYATYSYDTAWRGERSLSAKRGVLLNSAATDEEIIAAIKEVCQDIASAEHQGDDADRWDALMHECIADLPAEELA
jgi:hypothetical protein